MSNHYSFEYRSAYEEDAAPFPEGKTLVSNLTFEESSTWPPILWEFCKFLEATGYVGVTNKVILKDMYGMNDGADGHFFEVLQKEADGE
jgi:hypothetical protein